MPETDELVMHVQHRDAHAAHRQWLEDIARWREEHRQAAAMLKAAETAWSQAQAALDAHAQRIKTLEEHLTRHEQVFHDHGRTPDDAGPDPLLDEHREFDNKVIEPPGEAKSDAWIFNEIGRRVVPDKWWPDVDAMLDYQLRRGESKDGGPLKWKEFGEKLVSGCWGPDQTYYKYKTDFWREGGGFPTPSGKFEFHSNHLESLGYDPLPVFAEPGESPVSTPELYQEYPIVMSSGYRQPFYFLGQYRNIPWLRSFMEFPTCQLHPETAKLYGVEDGDIIWIESPRGRIRQKLRTFPGIKKGVLMATANCFYPEEPAKGYHGVFISNPNVLTSNDHLDPMYGSPDLTCLLCKVYKAKDDELTEHVFHTEEYGFVPSSGMQDT